MVDSCMNKESVEIIGLCDPSIFDLNANPYWTQIAVPENLFLPVQKPDIEQIISVNIKAVIGRQKIIVTPISHGDNYEGKNLSGNKLVVEGLLCQTVTYAADVPEQTVHSVQFAVPFSAFIVIPLQPTPPQNFQVNVCIEDVFIIKRSNRELFKNVTILLQAVPTSVGICQNEC